ncbi:MAG: zinc-binding dehydrogenase, partial [candidate division NC10 bacterium]|nr:zinc-binding dehydrogenase [candidate division NC10 bacterium]
MVEPVLGDRFFLAERSKNTLETDPFGQGDRNNHPPGRNQLLTDLGDFALVHAGAGGTGLLLIQLAKRAGAYVFATVSTEEKAGLAREAGADKAIIYTREDFQEAVNKATGGQGCQAVYDSVGQTTFEKSLNCVARRGCLALYGQS